MVKLFVVAVLNRWHAVLLRVILLHLAVGLLGLAAELTRLVTNSKTVLQLVVVLVGILCRELAPNLLLLDRC